MAVVTRVYLARHGQTALNVGGRLRGLSDPPLDDEGRAEAERLGAVLAEMRPTVVFSSPLQRAVATAVAIARRAGVEAKVEERLNDRDYGPWTAKVKADVERPFGSVDAAPGVEPAQEVFERGQGSVFRAGQRTACWNQLSLVDGSWRVATYDQKPEGS